VPAFCAYLLIGDGCLRKEVVQDYWPDKNATRALFCVVGFLNTLLTGLHACRADAITLILSTLLEKVGYKIPLCQWF